MLIEQGPWRLLLGLEWHMPMNRAEISKLKKEQRRLGHVMHKVGVHTWLGFHEDVDLAQVYSGALLLGQIKPQCIVHMALEHQLFWFCVLQNGLPLVGVDVILDKRQVQQHVQQYTTLFPNYDILSIDASQGLALIELLDTGGRPVPALHPGAKHIQAMRVTSPAQRKRKLRRMWILGVGALALCCAFLALLDVQLDLQAQAKQKIESTLKSTRMAEMALQSKAVQLKEAQAYAARLTEQRERYLFLSDRVAFWRAFNGLRHAIPLSANGLHPLAIRCELQACVVDWALKGAVTGAFSGERSALHALSSALPLALDQALNAKGEGTSTLALSLPRRPYFFPSIETPDVLELYMSLDLKKHWPTLMLTPMRTWVFDAKAGVKALPARALGSSFSLPTKSSTSSEPSRLTQTPQVLVHQGEWQLSFLGDAALIDAQRFIEAVQAAPVALQSIVYTYRGALELRGLYYFLPPLGAIDPSRVEFEGLASTIPSASQP